jgi:hypothetical protein
LYDSSNIIRVTKPRRIRWMGLIANMGELRKVYNILIGNPIGNRPLGRPRCR